MNKNKIYGNESMSRGIIIPAPEETEINKRLYPERYSDKPYPEYPEDFGGIRENKEE